MPKQMARLRQIDPNPFRDTGELAFRPEALRALSRDIEEHGFWGTLQTRVHPENPQRLQLVWGHHRMQVLRERLGEDLEVEVEVLALTDEEMLRRLVSENDPAYAGDALTYLQQVRATVGAFADGRVVLDAVPRKTRKTGIRRAPSFIRVDDRPDAPDRGAPDKAFTANTVGAFLGFTTSGAGGRTVAKPIVKELILACEAIERGEVDEASFRGVSIRAMGRIRMNAQRPRSAPPIGPTGRGSRNAERTAFAAAQGADAVTSGATSGGRSGGPIPKQARGPQPGGAGNDVVAHGADIAPPAAVPMAGPDAGPSPSGDGAIDVLCQPASVSAPPSDPAQPPAGQVVAAVGVRGRDVGAVLGRVLRLRSRYGALTHDLASSAEGRTDPAVLNAWIADLPVERQADALRLLASQLLNRNLAEREPRFHELLGGLLRRVTALQVRQEIERAGWTLSDGRTGKGRGRRGRRGRRRRT